ncbi:g1/s-specific cyclin-e [Anaeramoeba flamelloides]|uniref:G1/s-specific cyclin-e n=1 Tax=Anaeramoeba flamelloides TaxID=1746091 RepID=A0AAV8AD85_9EUKA|nr:g1/s-specific cyclin-e [Anaeramoeba flamelloides]
MNLGPFANGFFRNSFGSFPHSNQNQNQNQNHSENEQEQVIPEKVENEKLNNPNLFPKILNFQQKQPNSSKKLELNLKGIWNSSMSNKISDHPFLKKEKEKQLKKKIINEHFFGSKNNHQLNSSFYSTKINKNRNGNENGNGNGNGNENLKRSFQNVKENEKEKKNHKFSNSETNQIGNHSKLFPNVIRTNLAFNNSDNNSKNNNTNIDLNKRDLDDKKEKIRNILNKINLSNYPYSNQEYLTEQFESLLQREKRYQTDPFYLERQKFNELERIGVINWISLICDEQELQQETFLTATNIFDRYLSLYDNFPLQLLQVLGLVCLFIASKVEEVYSLTIQDLVEILDGKITKQTITKFEISIFNSLKFQINPVTTHNWLQFFIQKLVWEDPTKLPKELKEICILKCKFDPNTKIIPKNNYHKQRHNRNQNYNRNNIYTHSNNHNHYQNNNEKQNIFKNFSHFDKISNQMNNVNNNKNFQQNQKQPFSTFNLFQNSNFNLKKRENNDNNVDIGNTTNMSFDRNNHNSSNQFNSNLDDRKKRKPKNQYENFGDLQQNLKRKRFFQKKNQNLKFIHQQKIEEEEKEVEDDDDDECEEKKINNSYFQLKKNEQEIVGIDNEDLPKFCSGKIVNQPNSFQTNQQFPQLNKHNQNNLFYNNHQINNNNNNSNQFEFRSKPQFKFGFHLNNNDGNLVKGEEEEEEEEEIIYELFNESNSKKNNYPLNFNSFSQKTKPKKICQIKKINKHGSYIKKVYKVKEFPKKILFQLSQLLTILTMDPTSLQFLPSQIAASIFYLYFEKDFDNITQRITFYSKNHLHNCIDWITMYENFSFESPDNCSLDDENQSTCNLHLHNDQNQNFITDLFQNLSNLSTQDDFN